MKWNEFKKGVFLVNLLAIVYRKGKILIGLRRKDPYIPKLSWCFPGGRPRYGEKFEDALKREVKTKIGLDIKVKKILFARTYPEKKEFLSIYYLATAKNKKARPGVKFIKVKWIKPMEVKKYFTTSIDPFVLNVLKKLQKGGINAV